MGAPDGATFREAAPAGPESLVLGGAEVVALHDGAALSRVDSPRPYAHEVRTLSGVVATEITPADHRHHYGVGVVPADVDGTTFWGGRTYVRDVGSTMLDNHGRQVVRRSARTEDGRGWSAEIDWITEREELLGTEARELEARSHRAGWVLGWRTALVPTAPVSIGSPATNGRPGAFYGGWFWRSPFGAAHVLGRDRVGVDAVHGSLSPWLAVAAPGVTLIAAQRSEIRPWFVRSGQYLGFGPALAVDERLVLTPEAPLVIEVDVLVLDGARPDDEIRELAEELVAEA